MENLCVEKQEVSGQLKIPLAVLQVVSVPFLQLVGFYRF